MPRLKYEFQAAREFGNRSRIRNLIRRAQKNMMRRYSYSRYQDFTKNNEYSGIRNPRMKPLLNNGMKHHGR